MQMEKRDNLSVRRLLKQEIPAAMYLYSQFRRDGAWAAACLDRVFEEGEVWGGFLQEHLAVCGALCPANADNSQSRALHAAAPDASWQILPLAVLDAAAVAPFLRMLCARCTQLDPQAPWTAAVPVKTGECLLPGYLDAGFSIRLVRPLDHLRPHYLLKKREDRPVRCELCSFQVRDTYAVSRALEEGFSGDRIFWQQDVRWLELCRALDEN